MTKREKKQCCMPGCHKPANIDLVHVSHHELLAAFNRPEANYYCGAHFIGLIGELYRTFEHTKYKKYLEDTFEAIEMETN